MSQSAHSTSPAAAAPTSTGAALRGASTASAAPMTIAAAAAARPALANVSPQSHASSSSSAATQNAQHMDAHNTHTHGGAVHSSRGGRTAHASMAAVTVALSPFASPIGAASPPGPAHPPARGRAFRNTAAATSNTSSPRITGRDAAAAVAAAGAMPAAAASAAIAAVAALVPPPPPSAGLSLRTRDARGALSGYSYTSRTRSPRNTSGPRPSIYSGYARANMSAPSSAYYSDSGGGDSGHFHLHPALAPFSAASLPPYASTSLAHFASHPITFGSSPGTSPPHAHVHAHTHTHTHAQEGSRPASPTTTSGMLLPPLAHRSQPNGSGAMHLSTAYQPPMPAAHFVHPPPVPKQDRASQTSPVLSPLPTPTAAPVPAPLHESRSPEHLPLHDTLLPHGAAYSPALQRQLSTSPPQQPRRPGYDWTHARLHEFHAKELDDDENATDESGERLQQHGGALPAPVQTGCFLTDALVRFYGTLDDWDFDIFELHTITNGWPLSFLFMLLDKRSGFLSATGVPLETAWHFIQEVESNYLPLPYHTATHAADVLHASHHLVAHTPMLRSGLSPLHVFVLYLSAAVHDVQHPGLNNAFLVNARTPLAMRYNDRSVLESFHISSAFRLMAANPAANVLAHMPFATYSTVRKQLIDLVLSTDLAVHFELMGAFKRKIATHTAAITAAAAVVGPATPTAGAPSAAAPAAAPAAATATGAASTAVAAVAAAAPPAGSIDVVRSDEDRLMIMQIILKCGDLSHPARSRRLHLRWSEMVMEEFFLQGDREKQLNLPPSMFMDRATANLAQSQIGFITFLVYPMFQAYSSFAQRDFWAKRVEQNLEWWHEVARQEGEEKKAQERASVGSAGASDAEGSNVEGEMSESGGRCTSSAGSGSGGSSGNNSSSGGGVTGRGTTASSSSGTASSASEPNSASRLSSRRTSTDSVFSTSSSAANAPPASGSGSASASASTSASAPVAVPGESRRRRRSISVASTTVVSTSSAASLHGDGLSPPHPETPLSAGSSSGHAGPAATTATRKEVSFSVDVADKPAGGSTVPAAAAAAAGPTTPNSAPTATAASLQRRSSHVPSGTTNTGGRSRMSQRRSNTESSLTAAMAMLTETAQAAALSAAGASVDEAQEQQVEDAVAAQAQAEAQAQAQSTTNGVVATGTPKLPHLQLSLSTNRRMSAMKGVAPPASPLVLSHSIAHKTAAQHLQQQQQPSPVLTHGSSKRSSLAMSPQSLAAVDSDMLSALPADVMGPGLSVDVRASEPQGALCSEVHLLASPTHELETEGVNGNCNNALAPPPAVTPTSGEIPAFSKRAHAMLHADMPARPTAS